MADLQVLSNMLFVFSTLTNFFSTTSNSISTLNVERVVGAYSSTTDTQRNLTESIYTKAKKEIYIASLCNVLLLCIISVIIYKKYIFLSSRKSKKKNYTKKR